MFRVELHYEFEDWDEAYAFAKASDTYAQIYGIDPSESHWSWESHPRERLEYYLRDDIWDGWTPERRDAVQAEVRAELERRGACV